MLDELTPDDAKSALILYDSRHRAVQLTEWLKAERDCRPDRIFATDRAELYAAGRHFLFWPDAQRLVLPSEIVADKLFLGSRASAHDQAIRLLEISAVVSLLDITIGQPVSPPKGVRHLLIPILDRGDADLNDAIGKALPFLFGELSQPKGRVLVHCEAGQSRSASIVMAALMADPRLMGCLDPAATISANDALAFVREQRPQVKPNDGFMQKLRTGSYPPMASVCAPTVSFQMRSG